MKKTCKYFMFIFFSFLAVLFLTSTPVEANYDPARNTAHIAVNKNEVRITVTFQRGIDKEEAVYQWCKRDNIGVEIKSLSDCRNPVGNSVKYIVEGGDNTLNYISSGDASYVDEHATTYTFTVSKSKDDFLGGENGNGIQNNEYYTIVVSHYFCERRSDGNGSCDYFDFDNVYTTLDVSGSDIKNGKTIGGSGSSIDSIEDEGIKTMMDKVYDVVHGTVMPVIWAVLGLFLLIKGTVLGVQIVKSADEPQVRKEKIESMKWLVVGIAIAYASTFVVDLVVGFFSTAFK